MFGGCAFKICLKVLRRNLTKMNKTSSKSKVTDQGAPRTLSALAAAGKLGSNVKFETLPSPVKSASDKKEYKVIRLENGLTVSLVSDVAALVDLDDSEETDDDIESESESESESEHSGGSSMESDEDDDGSSEGEQKMAAAALCIGVGSYSDPKDIPGMAHFLEHMVFMGSEKFPKENDFDSYLSKRGGHDNASTDCETTTFYFECLEKHLLTALDKFAQFFISPLMKRGSMEREREAIESEFQMALPSDAYRKEQLLASFSKNESPVNTFTWGNLITLRDNVNDDKLYESVHEFRKRHYSAHRMTLAIQARLPMEMLQSYVLECFAKVPNNQQPPDDFTLFQEVFATPEFNKLYYMQPTNNVTQVELTWSLPSLKHKYKSKPHQYVSWLLGDEGKGSLLAYLRKKVWALTISTGNDETGSEHNSMYALFTVSMTLTSDGLTNLREVIESMFSYINMLKAMGPQERIYNEIKAIEDTSFQFAVEESAVDWMEELAENMQMYPPEDYIAGSELYYEYDPEAIKMVLDNLTPRKLNILVLSDTLPKGLSYNKTEKWFGTQYTDQVIPEKWIKSWQAAKPRPEFAIPPPNQFLTTDFTILPVAEDHPDYPKKLVKTELGELWYRKDQKFQLPTAYYYFCLISPVALESPKSVAMLDLLVDLLQIQLVEETYPAEVADLSFKLRTNDKGIFLSISGYNEKLHMLVELITKYVVAFNSALTKNVFEAVKDKLIKQYYNILLKPTSLAKDIRFKVLVNNYHALVDKYNAVASVSLDDMKHFAEAFVGQLYIKALVQGNVTAEAATKVFNNFVAGLNSRAIPKESYPKFRVIAVPTGETLCQLESFNSNDSNSIVTNYYQSGSFSIKESVIIEMIMLIIEEPLFDILRTKEQLGYHVSCSIRETYGILGFTIMVNTQAIKHTTEYVNDRIGAFVEATLKSLEDMSEKTFEEMKRNLVKVKKVSDVRLKEEVARNWDEIVDDDYIFDRLKQEIDIIESFKVKDVQEWWREHCCSREKFKKLSLQVVGFDTSDHRDNETHDHSQPLNRGTKLALKLLVEANKDGSDSPAAIIKDIDAFKEKVDLHPVRLIDI